MGQEEIIQILKNEKSGMTAREISERSGIGRNSVSSALRRLLKFNEIIKEEITLEGNIISFLWLLKEKNESKN